MAVAFSGCAAPSLPDAQGRAGKTLFIRPLLVDGMLRTQGLVNPKTAKDVAVLEVIPYVHVGNGVFWPLSTLTGEATDSPDPQQIRTSRQEGFDPDGQPLISLTGLSPDTLYRIRARAYDASASVISTDDARSEVEVKVGADDRPELPLTLPVTLIDTPFGATYQVSFQVTGAFDSLAVALTVFRGELEEPVPNGTFSLSAAEATSPVTLTHLEAKTTYRLTVKALDGNGDELASKATDLSIGIDDAPVQLDVALHVP
jgi:hypothetical protein